MLDQIIKFWGITDYEAFDKYLIVTGTNKNGKPMCQIYNTNVKLVYKAKVSGYYFLNEAQRDIHVSDFKRRINERRIYQLERIEARKNFENPAQVGDILSSSWGYEQTNIDFYQVVEIKGKSVMLQEIAKDVEQGEYYMTGTCTPIKDHFKGEPMKKLVKSHYTGKGYVVSINSFAIATPWDGRPEHWTAYA